MSLSFSEIAFRDKVLYEVAMYDVLKGMMKIYDTDEEYDAFKSLAVKRFNLYKRLIIVGEFTFEELVEYVTNKYAAKLEENLTIYPGRAGESKRLFKYCEEQEKRVKQMDVVQAISNIFNVNTGKLDGLNSIPKTDIDKNFTKKKRAKKTNKDSEPESEK